MSKTTSETLFETYLAERGFIDFEYEPEVEGTSKHPDYRVSVGASETFFEVKEFEHQEVSQCGSFDPYPCIRSKVNDAQKQLRALKGRMCSIVLANPYNNPLVLFDPIIIYGVMLGNLGVTIPVNLETWECDDAQAKWDFLSGGKMIRYKGDKAIASQNTTISAICVLGQFTEECRRDRIQSEREIGRKLTDVERIGLELLRITQGNAPTYHVRIQVYENPYAIAPLTEAFGTGPYDERFRIENGQPHRVFAGHLLKALEEDELAAGVMQKDPHGIRKG